MENIEITLKNVTVGEMRMKGNRARFNLSLPIGEVGGVLAEWKDVLQPETFVTVHIKVEPKAEAKKDWSLPGGTEPGPGEKS